MRVVEIGTSGSSASLRAVEPYTALAPFVTAQGLVPFLGLGPGSSQVLVSATRIEGLLVPTPLKVFFDYGLLAGGALAVFLLACYRRSASRSLAVGLLVSLWSLQPGLTTTVLVLTVVVFVSLWAPQQGLQLEDVTHVDAPPATAVAGRDPAGGSGRDRGHTRPARASSGAVARSAATSGGRGR